MRRATSTCRRAGPERDLEPGPVAEFERAEFREGALRGHVGDREATATPAVVVDAARLDDTAVADDDTARQRVRAVIFLVFGRRQVAEPETAVPLVLVVDRAYAGHPAEEGLPAVIAAAADLAAAHFDDRVGSAHAV